MAWFSALFGALGGLVLAVGAGLITGWPLWLIALLYPVAAAVLMLGMLAVQLWRSGNPRSPKQGAGASQGRGPEVRPGQQPGQF
ncbi:hypothetical protein [Leisingera sp. JC1]|uniref:hypothetical protein n=1 Tax=Leisingera sp. JC1 TaxID=1855282 RepID=UPI000802A97F|nr:hypothetical protein [Leisingera sp. JC1]OBY26735.1 hypothetical protein A9D60_17920 [Leisingera sp. JC1]